MVVAASITVRKMRFVWIFEPGLDHWTGAGFHWDWVPDGLVFCLEKDISIPASLEAQIASSILYKHAHFAVSIWW